MKKLGLLVMPLMAISILVSCGNKVRKDPTPEEIPLNFTCLSDATLEVFFEIGKEHNPDEFLLESSMDQKTWERVEPIYEEEDDYHHWFNLKKGDIIYFRSDNHNGYDDYHFHLTFKNKRFEETGELSVGGNIMSLLYKDKFAKLTKIPSNDCFYQLFAGNKILVDASDLLLPATTLADECYLEMFKGDNSLKKAPSLLPSTILDEGCYTRMFNGCEALMSAPSLPASKLKERCYLDMFNGCSSLKISEGTGENLIFTCPSELPEESVTNMFCDVGGSFLEGTPTANNNYYWNA